jgi:diguanylate cyclase (GGDEF)-like protein/PAS domain S-box-containing protein
MVAIIACAAVVSAAVVLQIPSTYGPFAQGVAGVGLLLLACAPLLWHLVVQPTGAAFALDLKQLTGLINAGPEPILAVTEDGRICFANRRALEVFDYAESELLGSPIELLVPERFASRHADRRAQYAQWAATRPMGTGLTVHGRRRDGSEFPADVSLSRVPIRNGAVIISAVRDITAQQRQQDELQSANARLQRGLVEIEQRVGQLRLLSEMGELLASCRTEEESHAVIARFLRLLFPDSSGALFVINASRNSVERGATWGDCAESCPTGFPPDACWALRRGRLHVVTRDNAAMCCEHSTMQRPQDQVCVPMLAQGEAVGVLNLVMDSASTGNRGPLDPSQRQLLFAAAEHIGLATANIRLREALKSQSIRDPLTGLYNRRFMEEWLERELRRTERLGQPLSVLALDLDHFKRFNDAFGHEGGDLVLREVGSLLRGLVRTSDIICRVGGEELVLLLPETPLASALQIAELIRAAVAKLAVLLRNRPLGAVTVSIGVAEFTRHGPGAQALLAAADAALYQAKHAGRNRVAEAAAPSSEDRRTTKNASDCVGVIDIRSAAAKSLP